MLHILLIFLTLFLFSCAKENEPKIEANKESLVKPKVFETAELDVPLLDAQVFQDLLAKHRGKILFINAWATWCIPCKEEFPDLIRLKESYHDTEVEIIGISVDLPDQIDSAVKPFLISQNVNFLNYIQNFKDPAQLIDLLNKNWRGAVPATFIYDRDGNQQAFLLGKHSFEDFKTTIESIRKTN
jgi:thiol-disulfide isomerase/thioredoxin